MDEYDPDPRDEDYDPESGMYGWTAFWEWARANGYPDRTAIAAALGKPHLQMTPIRLRRELERTKRERDWGERQRAKRERQAALTLLAERTLHPAAVPPTVQSACQNSAWDGIVRPHAQRETEEREEASHPTPSPTVDPLALPSPPSGFMPYTGGPLPLKPKGSALFSKTENRVVAFLFCLVVAIGLVAIYFDDAIAEEIALAATYPTATVASRTSLPPSYSTGRSLYDAGCGTRGGPGYRLSNGKCASWRDYEAGREVPSYYDDYDDRDYDYDDYHC